MQLSCEVKPAESDSVTSEWCSVEYLGVGTSYFRGSFSKIYYPKSGATISFVEYYYMKISWLSRLTCCRASLAIIIMSKNVSVIRNNCNG